MFSNNIFEHCSRNPFLARKTVRWHLLACHRTDPKHFDGTSYMTSEYMKKNIIENQNKKKKWTKRRQAFNKLWHYKINFYRFGVNKYHSKMNKLNHLNLLFEILWTCNDTITRYILKSYYTNHARNKWKQEMRKLSVGPETAISLLSNLSIMSLYSIFFFIFFCLFTLNSTRSDNLT